MICNDLIIKEFTKYRIPSLFPASISSDPKSWNGPGCRSRLRTKWTPESSLPWVPPTSATRFTRLHRMALLLLRATTAQAVTANSGRGGYRRGSGRGGKHSVKGAIPWSTRSIRRIWDGLAPIWWRAKIIYMSNCTWVSMQLSTSKNQFVLLHFLKAAPDLKNSEVWQVRLAKEWIDQGPTSAKTPTILSIAWLFQRCRMCWSCQLRKFTSFEYVSNMMLDC